MHIVAYVHGYPPFHNAGAEWMLHSILRDMTHRGYTATVLTNLPDEGVVRGIAPKDIYFEGVRVRSLAHHTDAEMRMADIVITHLEKGSDARHGAPAWCRKYGKPLIRLVHNERELYVNSARADNTALLVFNSDWLAASYNAAVGAANTPEDKKFSTADWPQIVLPPPTDTAYYGATDPTPRDCVTLINLNYNKGGTLLYDIARELPDIPFLGVKGGYDMQHVASAPNVSIVDNTPDIRAVYARTKVLIVPSLIETWGRVAIEAMAAGIPVIACPTNGLSEACAGAAIYKKRNDLAGWVSEIRKLYSDSSYYAKFADLGRKRAKEIDTLVKGRLDDLDSIFQKLRKGNPTMAEKETPKVAVIARKPFRHNGVAHAAGPTFVPESQVEFLRIRGLIQVETASNNHSDRETKPDPAPQSRSKK